VIDEKEAATVRMIFERFARIGSATGLARELVAKGVTIRSGKPIDKGFLYKTLNNRVYIGQAVHKGTAYPGEHKSIIPQSLWDKVHAIVQDSPRARAGRTRAQTPALLKGLLFGPDAKAMSPTHTRKDQKLYRYVSQSVLKHGAGCAQIGRVSANEIENAVVSQLRGLLRAPEIVVATWRAGRAAIPGLAEREVRDALERFDPLWNELFPAEQARIVQLLVERVDVGESGLDIRLRTDELVSIVRDLGASEARRAA
jgi:site-specific DNA recombinase